MTPRIRLLYTSLRISSQVGLLTSLNKQKIISSSSSTSSGLWMTTDGEGSSLGTTDSTPVAGYQSSDAGCSRYKFIAYTYVLCFIALVGVVGNVLQFVVMWPGRRKSATTVLLLILALLDNLMIMSLVYQISLPDILVLDPEMNRAVIGYHRKLYGFTWAFIDVFRILNVWVTVLISMQRYLAVCWPITAKQFSSAKSDVRQSVLVILILLAFIAPRFLEGYSKYTKTQMSFLISSVYTVVYKIWI